MTSFPIRVLTDERTTRTHVELTIHNSIGQAIATPFNGTLEAGEHRLFFDASVLEEGKYFAVFRIGGIVKARGFDVLR